MDLRRRTLLVVALSFAGIAVALYFVLSTTVLGELSSYERSDAESATRDEAKNYESELDSLQAEVEKIAKSGSYTYYLSSRDLRALGSGQPYTELQAKGYKLAIVVGNNGKPLAGYYDSMANWNSKGWSSNIGQQLSGKDWPDFSSFTGKAEKLRGLVNVEGHALVVAAATINGGRGRGYLVLGKPLDAVDIFKVKKGSEAVAISTSWASAKNLSRTFSEADSKMAKDPRIHTKDLNSSNIAGFLRLPSVSGKDIFLVQVEVPRQVAQSGKEFLARALIVLGLSVLICGSLLWMILDRQVLSRLGQLSAGVASVGAKGDPSLRVNLVGDDEVARLSLSINQMLGDLERSQTEVKESEQRFSALSAASFEAILIHDGANIVDVNQALLNLFGFKREELIGNEIELIAPRWLTDGIWKNAAGAGEEPFEAFGATNAGVTVPLEVRLRTLPYRGRDFRVAALRDISERRKAEAALRESEERYRRLVDLAQEGIVSNDANEVITFCNPTFASVLGYTPQQLAGRSLIELCTPQSAERMLQEASKRRSGLSGTYEVEMVSRDNRTRAFHLTARPMFDESGSYEGSLGVFTDITERKQTEQAWLTAQKAESLGVLAGGIAHDFNNLLVGIIGNISLALDTLPPASPVLKYLTEVDKASQRASELVEQMLAYSGKGRLALRKVDLNNIIEETIRLMGTSVPKHIQLELDLGRPLQTIDADEGLIRQMITSFLLNSVEAIDHAEGSIRIHTGMLELNSDNLRNIAPSSELQPGRFVFVSVTDNGMGMDHEVRDKVFDPFFSTKFAGRGLGLAAVQGIVKRHRGAIQLESEPGRGSSFRVILPVAAPAAPTVQQGRSTSTNPDELSHGSNGKAREQLAVVQGGGSGRTEAETLAAGSQGSGQAEVAVAEPLTQAKPLVLEDKAERRVLVIAQESTVRQVTSRILEQHGFAVESVTDAAGALRSYEKDPGRYELVLLDLDMSEVPGTDVYKMLQRVNPDIKAVLISGELDSGTMLTRAGIDAPVLRKPFSPTQLVDAIEGRN